MERESIRGSGAELAVESGFPSYRNAPERRSGSFLTTGTDPHYRLAFPRSPWTTAFRFFFLFTTGSLSGVHGQSLWWWSGAKSLKLFALFYAYIRHIKKLQGVLEIQFRSLSTIFFKHFGSSSLEAPLNAALITPESGQDFSDFPQLKRIMGRPLPSFSPGQLHDPFTFSVSFGSLCGMGSYSI
jgi:hypothetical protein